MTPDTLDERQRASVRHRTGSRRRWLPPALWVIAAIAGFVVYLRLAFATPVNSDGATEALMAWDMLHGNPLLGGWTTADVTFYTFEVPVDLLIELVRGLNAEVVQVGAAIAYTLVALLAVALAKGNATGREALVRILMAGGIMLAPELGWGTHELVSSPDHIGTTIPVMAAWLILDRAPRRWWVPVVTTLLLAWAVIGDQVVLAIAILPLIGVCALRALRPGERRHEIALAAGGVVAGVAGEAAPRVIYALGGYDMGKVNSTIVSMDKILTNNVPVAHNGVLILYGAYLPGLPAGAQSWVAVLHAVGLVLAGCGILLTAWRFFRGEALVPQLLLAGIVVVGGAFIVGAHAAVLQNAREISAVLPFGAILAARQLSPFLARPPAHKIAVWARRIAVPALGVVLAGYVAGLGVELTAPAAQPQNIQLTDWLMQHPLGGTGFSGYWESNVATLTSGGRVGVHTLNIRDGQTNVPHPSGSKLQWWDPARTYTDFVVLGPVVQGTPGVPGFDQRAAVISAFGQPARVYHVGAYTIMQWHKNLVPYLHRG